MDVLPSSEFRKRYATLRDTTTVTVNGHAIGFWTPFLSDAEVLERVRAIPGMTKDELKNTLLRPKPAGEIVVTQPSVGSPFAQFRPVPKPGRK